MVLANSSLEKKLPWAVEFTAIIAFMLGVLHVFLYGRLIALFNLALVSFLFTVAFVFISLVINKKASCTKGHFPTVIFLCFYILLITCLGINKVVPEYGYIKSYYQQKNNLIVDVAKQNDVAILRLAKLFMLSPDVIERVEPGVHKKGIDIMEYFLSKKIESGKGYSYSAEMLEMATTGFKYVDENFALNWFNTSYQYGESDALEVYNKLISEKAVQETLLNSFLSFLYKYF